MSIDFRYLKAFALTAKYLNFSKAAQELKIAQSAVSRQVKLLEESLGEQLIVRSSQKVILTEKGKELARSVEKFEEMTSHLSKTSGPQVIRVGILHGLLENWFIQVIKDFNKNSDHTLVVEADTPLKLKEGILAGNFDIIFTTENIQSDLVTSLALFKEELVLISKQEVDPKNVCELPWVVYNENDFLFDLYKKSSDKVFIVKSVTSVIKLVKEGVGVAVTPAHTVIKEKSLKKYPVKNGQRPVIHMSTLSFNKLPEHLSDLAQAVRRNL